MVTAGNIVITSSIEEILMLLKADLAASGIIRFEKIKRTSSNVMTQCPFHSNGLEKKPSFGISDSGECHCFACGWASKHFDQFISELFGFFDGGDFGRQWLQGQLSGGFTERHIDLSFNKPKQNTKVEIVSEAELDSYRYTHPYMYQRGLTDSLIEVFDIGYDRDRQCLTFPIKNLNGDVVFIARRSVNTKFFMLPYGKEKPIYLADLFVTGKYKKAVLVESFLNALTCWKFGIPAMALIGTGSHTQYPILKALPVRSYIIALDNDNAGKLGTRRLVNALSSSKKLTKWELPEGKDVNDLDSDILNMKEKLV